MLIGAAVPTGSPSPDDDVGRPRLTDQHALRNSLNEHLHQILVEA